MKSFRIGLGKEQYVQSMDFLALLYSYFRDVKVDTKVVRPTCGVKENPRQWWKYAYDRVAEKIHQERRPDYFALRHEYIKIYAKKMNGEESLTDPESARLEEIQHTLSKKDIVLFRYVANCRVKMNKKKKQEQQAEKAKSTGWFGWLTGSGSSSSVDDSGSTGLSFMQDLGIKMSDNDLKEFTGFIDTLRTDFNSSADLSEEGEESGGGESGKDSPGTKEPGQRTKGGKKLLYVKVALDEASLSLSKEDAELCKMDFTGITGAFENFVLTKSWNFSFGVWEASIENHTPRVTGPDGQPQPQPQSQDERPILLLKNGAREDSFKFDVQSFPEAYPECDFYVGVQVMPVCIVAQKAVVSNIMDFFTLPPSVDMRSLKGYTQGKGKDKSQDQQKELSAAQIARLTEQSIRTKLDVVLREPTIIYPMANKRGPEEEEEEGSADLIFVAKDLSIFTGGAADARRPDFYDRASFVLSNAELLIKRYATTTATEAEEVQATTLVECFTVSGSVGKCKLLPNSEHPQFTVSCRLTPIRFDITDNVVSDMLALIPKSNNNNSSKTNEGTSPKRVIAATAAAAIKKVSVEVGVDLVDVDLIYRGKKLVNGLGKGITVGVQAGTEGVAVAVGIESGKLTNLLRDTTPILDETPVAVRVVVAPGKPLDIGVTMKGKVLATLDIGVVCSLLTFFQINTKPSPPPEVLIKRPFLNIIISVSVPRGGQVRFLLFDQTAELIGVFGSSLDLSIAVRRLCFSVTGRVTGFSAVVEDGNDLLVKSPKYKTVLVSKEHEGCTLDFAFDSFSPHETEIGYPGYTYILKLSTQNGVRVVFLLNFIINLLSNIMKIVENAPRPERGVGEAVAATANETTKFVIDVCAPQPTIVIPRSSASDDHFLVTPREAFTLRSSYDDEKRLCNYAFHVGTVDVVNDAGAPAGTVTDLDFVYSMPTDSTPFWELDFQSTGTLEMKLNKTRYNNLVSTIWENFCESNNRVNQGLPPQPQPPRQQQQQSSRSLCKFTVEKGIELVLQSPESDTDYVILSASRCFVSFESLFQKARTEARMESLSARWVNKRGRELIPILGTDGTTVYVQENTYAPEKTEMKMDLDCHFISSPPWYEPLKFTWDFLYPEQRTFNAMNKNNENPNKETHYFFDMRTKTLEVPFSHAKRDFARAVVVGCSCSVEWNNRDISMKYVHNTKTHTHTHSHVLLTHCFIYACTGRRYQRLQVAVLSKRRRWDGESPVVQGDKRSCELLCGLQREGGAFPEGATQQAEGGAQLEVCRGDGPLFVGGFGQDDKGAEHPGNGDRREDGCARHVFLGHRARGALRRDPRETDTREARVGHGTDLREDTRHHREEDRARAHPGLPEAERADHTRGHRGICRDRARSPQGRCCGQGRGSVPDKARNSSCQGHCVFTRPSIAATARFARRQSRRRRRRGGGGRRREKRRGRGGGRKG